MRFDHIYIFFNFRFHFIYFSSLDFAVCAHSQAFTENIKFVKIASFLAGFLMSLDRVGKEFLFYILLFWNVYEYRTFINNQNTKNLAGYCWVYSKFPYPLYSLDNFTFKSEKMKFNFWSLHCRELNNNNATHSLNVLLTVNHKIA